MISEVTPRMRKSASVSRSALKSELAMLLKMILLRESSASANFYLLSRALMLSLPFSLGVSSRQVRKSLLK